MNLQDWLFTRVFPFEDQLSGESVYWGTLLSMAESLKFGIVSTSDMYFFVNDMAEAYLKAGVKGNLSRCISHFDDSDFITSFRAEEMIDLYEKYHKAGDGKILIDMSLHSEYTTTPIAVKQLAEHKGFLPTRIAWLYCGRSYPGQQPVWLRQTLYKIR